MSTVLLQTASEREVWTRSSIFRVYKQAAGREERGCSTLYHNGSHRFHCDRIPAYPFGWLNGIHPKMLTRKKDYPGGGCR